MNKKADVWAPHSHLVNGVWFLGHSTWRPWNRVPLTFWLQVSPKVPSAASLCLFLGSFQRDNSTFPLRGSWCLGLAWMSSWASLGCKEQQLWKSGLVRKDSWDDQACGEMLTYLFLLWAPLVWNAGHTEIWWRKIKKLISQMTPGNKTFIPCYEKSDGPLGDVRNCHI